MELDHVAVPSRDIAASVTWYVEKFGAPVLYQDATWAFLKLGQGKLALVTPSQHPPHTAVRVDEATLARAAAGRGQGRGPAPGRDEGDLYQRPGRQPGGIDLLPAGRDGVREGSNG